MFANLDKPIGAVLIQPAARTCRPPWPGFAHLAINAESDRAAEAETVCSKALMTTLAGGMHISRARGSTAPVKHHHPVRLANADGGSTTREARRRRGAI